MERTATCDSLTDAPRATPLSFVVAAVQIGEPLGLVAPATGASLVAAGLVAVLAFPLAAGVVLRTVSAGVSEAGAAG